MHLPPVVSAFLVCSDIYVFRAKSSYLRNSEFLCIILDLFLLNYPFLQIHKQLR